MRPIDRRSDFSDRHIVVCRPGDHRLGFVWSERGGFEQSCDGPTFIVIGRDTTDQCCDELEARFGIDAADLIAFRCRSALEPQQPYAKVHAAA